MFAKLAENRADVKVNFARVRNQQSLSYVLFTVVQTLVLKSESHLEVVERITQFVGLAAKAGEVVVSDRFDSQVAL